MHITIQHHIYGCFECPEAKNSGGVNLCGQSKERAEIVYDENVNSITPSCPLAPDEPWPT